MPIQLLNKIKAVTNIAIDIFIDLVGSSALLLLIKASIWLVIDIFALLVLNIIHNIKHALYKAYKGCLIFVKPHRGNMVNFNTTANEED